MKEALRSADTISDRVVIGVDIGTTTTKALAVDESGRPQGSAQRDTRWTRTGERTEVSAESILGDVLATIGDLIAVVESRVGHFSVSGLGLAGLGESGFLLDHRGAPVGPAIAWFDPRGKHEMASLGPELTDQFPARTGLKVGPQCTVAKLLWMRSTGIRTGPGSCWLNIPEYVAHVLGAARATEPSLASRTGLLDQATGSSYAEMLHQAGLTADVLPPTVPAGRPIGTVTSREAPRQLRGATVTIAGHDHGVAAVGAGAVEGHQLFNSYGTADVFLRSVTGPLSDSMRSNLVAHGVDAGRHNLPGRSALITGIRGGLLLQRTLQLLEATDPAARAALDRSLPAERAGLPTPAATVSIGEDGSLSVVAKDEATRTDIWQAALARVTVDAARRTEAIERIVGPQSTALAAGGWTALSSVRTARRRAIPDITFSEVLEPGATGAALFAAYAAQGAAGDFVTFLHRLDLPGRALQTPHPLHPRGETVHG
jgi:sugar (pentulose or hexulose) kinase